MSDASPSHGGPSFGRFWAAATLSSFGTAVTTVAMPVLVVTTLEASAFEVGVVNAAQFVPYAVLGLLAGVYADRWRRQRILVWSSLGRAVTLGAIPVLSALGALEVWALVVLLLLFGSFSVFAFAATQSLLPRLVPRERLVVANARLDQSDAAAQTLGPAIGGGLVGLLGAPAAIAVDAVSYLVDAVLNAGLRVEEPPTDASAARHLGREIGEGLRWTYRHPTLAPLAASTHVWFLANAAGFTALSLVALREMALSAFVFGLLVAVAGITGLVGASLAPALGRRIGAGPAIIGARAPYPLAWLLVALAPTVPPTAGVTLLTLALGVHGLAGGLENASDMGLWQLITPDGLLGRVNATRRSVNRSIAALGAVLGGTSVMFLGGSATLVGVAVVFGLAFAVAALSPLRAVRQVD
ncbi:MFS transporter [Nocardioides sp.]|uniref:MFS transporter n=1 Tax=Nocardioides sp. TaxID=35761 RepID=UPI00286A8A4D|nr:MFS transporter [Nocardioides sp.]